MTTRRAVLVGMVASLGLVAIVSTLSYSQGTGGSPTTRAGEPRKLAPRDPSKPADKSQRVRVRNADRARYDSARGMFYLFGNVLFEDEDEVKLYCDEASYNENDDTAACAGHLKVTDKDNVITGDLINADFDAEIVNIEGNVKIVTTKATKKKEGEKTSEEKRVTTITCDKIVYYYTTGKRRAVATGNLKAVQEDKTVLAPRADYDREKDLITLGDKITIKMENGNEFECTRATIGVSDDTVDMEGITGIFFRDKNKEKGTQPPATTPTPAPPAPAPPAKPSG
ncbi:hypothetical protein LLH03_17850 [bacterium]|nr:hypothetical protein [bacterium]